MPFPTEAARDVLGLLRAMWAAETDPHRRRELARAGHQVRQALDLAETNPAQAHLLVDQALAAAQSSMKYYAPLAPIWTAAAARAKKR